MFSVFESSGKDLSWIDRDNYVLADTAEKALACIAECFTVPDEQLLGCDTEETGLGIFTDKLVGICLAPRPGRAFYIPVYHQFDQNVSLAEIIGPLEELLVTKSLVGHNAEFDWVRINKFLGIDANFEHCTSIRACLLDSDLCQRKELRGLDRLSEKHLGITMLQMHDLVSIPKGSYNFSLANTADALYYAAADADVALRLFHQQEAEFKKNGLDRIYQIEMRVMKAAGEMFMNGSKADKAYLSSLNLREDISSLESKIKAVLGEINLNSPEQVAEVLFDKIGLERIDGNSVDDSVLSALSGVHPVVEDMRKYRTLEKFQHGFIDKLSDCISEDDRIHSQFDQMGARTGRFSSSGGIGLNGKKIKFNAQTLPKPHEEDPNDINMRRAIIPENGHILISQDFKQVEYLIIGNASQEPHLLEKMRQGVDFHKAAAALIFRVPIEQVTEELRRKAKEINFALVYGYGDASLAAKLKIPLEEAKALKKEYFSVLAKVKALIDAKRAFAKKYHLIQTEFGRIRYYHDLDTLEDWQAGRILNSAFNTYVQGTAADLNKYALARVRSVIRKYSLPVKMLSTIHDECNTECNMQSRPKDVLPHLDRAMTIKEGTIPGWLAFKTDLSIGFSYGTMVSVPEEYFDKYDSWDDLYKACLDLKAAKKAPAPVVVPEVKPASKAPALELSIAPRKVQRIIPSIVVTINPGHEPHKCLEVLKTLTDTNHGLYSMYVEADQGFEFLVTKVKVNPSSRFIKSLQSSGMRIKVNLPQEEPVWDPAVLSF